MVLYASLPPAAPLHIGYPLASRKSPTMSAPARSTPPLVSLCVIARDEAATIDRCLRSSSLAVDEAWVLDTGSRDATAAIAASCGARVVHWPWRDDFAAARNAVIELARGRFVVMLDADEYFEPEAAAALRQRIAREDFDGLQLVIRNLTPPGDMLSWTEFSLTRVFRNHPLIRYEGRIHEQVAPSILRGGGRVAASTIRVIHSGYRSQTAQGTNRAARNLTALETSLRAQPEDAYLWYQWGLTQKAMGNLAAARQGLERAHALGLRGLGPDAAVTLHTRLAQVCWGLGDPQRAHVHAGEALRRQPGDALSLALWGMTGLQLGLGRAMLPALHAAARAEAIAAPMREELTRLVKWLDG